MRASNNRLAMKCPVARGTLTRAERLLLREFKLPDGVRGQLEKDSPHPLEVWMTVDEAEYLREQVGERLQLEGFGPDYKPTEIARSLETLIDKLYTG